jgi:hypothetical protein
VVSILLAFPSACLFSPHSGYKPRPSHLPSVDYSNYTWRRVQIMKLLVMQVSSTLRSPHPTSVQIFSSALCSQAPSVYVPPVMSRDQVSHPYRTTGEIIVLYILMFTFFDTDEKTGFQLTCYIRKTYTNLECINIHKTSLLLLEAVPITRGLLVVQAHI